MDKPCSRGTCNTYLNSIGATDNHFTRIVFNFSIWSVDGAHSRFNVVVSGKISREAVKFHHLKFAAVLAIFCFEHTDDSLLFDMIYKLLVRENSCAFTGSPASSAAITTTIASATAATTTIVSTAAATTAAATVSLKATEMRVLSSANKKVDGKR